MTQSAAGPLLPRADASWFTEWRRTLDWGLVAGVLLLVAIGLLMSLAVGPSAAAKLGYRDDPYYFVYRQALFSVIGVGLMLAVSLMDRTWARRFAIAVFFGSIFLMGVILAIGNEVKGAQSWLRFSGFSVQPTELVKPTLLVLCAWLLAQRDRYPAGPWALLSFGFYAFTLGLFLLQPDVGGAALMSLAFITAFYVSGMPKRWIGGIVAGGAALSVLLYLVLPNVKRRIDILIHPAKVDTFQIDRTREAIARGGIQGTGPGEGQVKIEIPEAHNDFIFAVIAEEFGLIAMIVVIAIFGLMTIRGFRAAARIEDGFARTAAAGLFGLFAFQAVVNIGVNLAILPPTGLTLPFISYGGSSMVGMGLTLGLALALVRGEGTRSRGPYG